MSTLDTAISLVAQQFEGVYDRGGKPYVLHCLHVTNTVMQRYPDDEELAMIAVMHDLIEDTDVTLLDLRHGFGFSSRVVKTLCWLTHDPEDSYEDYIEMICADNDAIKVKMADIEHNSDITRLKGLRDKDLARVAKYHKSYEILKKSLDK